MIQNGATNKAAIARSVTWKTHGVIPGDALEAMSWDAGFTAYLDVPLMQEAVRSRLVQWTPRVLRIRRSNTEAFLEVEDFEWLEIPRSQLLRL